VKTGTAGLGGGNVTACVMSYGITASASMSALGSGTVISRKKTTVLAAMTA
jgi:hypothetical protein